jgi:hypothetical protein
MARAAVWALWSWLPRQLRSTGKETLAGSVYGQGSK